MSRRIIICLCLCASTIAASIKKTRIVGGVDAEIDEFPFLASLRRISDNIHVCGGSILNERFILTAAHCFGEKHVTLDNLKIVLGSSYISRDKGNTYKAERIFSHPGFVGLAGGISYFHDIALVKLRDAIKFNDLQKPIKLPDRDIHHGDIGVLGGWGIIDHKSKRAPKQLQKVRMTVQENDRCKFVTYKLHKDQFCGYRGVGIGACIGDSGSPLVFDNSVIGIASVTIPCAKGIPDGYTNVYMYLDFIHTVLKR